jgi:hypothetical protein
LWFPPATDVNTSGEKGSEHPKPAPSAKASKKSKKSPIQPVDPSQGGLFLTPAIQRSAAHDPEAGSPGRSYYVMAHPAVISGLLSPGPHSATLVYRGFKVPGKIHEWVLDELNNRVLDEALRVGRRADKSGETRDGVDSESESGPVRQGNASPTETLWVHILSNHLDRPFIPEASIPGVFHFHLTPPQSLRGDLINALSQVYGRPTPGSQSRSTDENDLHDLHDGPVSFKLTAHDRTGHPSHIPLMVALWRLKLATGGGWTIADPK